MAALTPHPPYTDEELDRLYPPGLQLEQVQILLRHGERTPVSPRFQNAGLPANWAYCNVAKRIRDTIATSTDASIWDGLIFKRRLETFGQDDHPVIATGPLGTVDAVCKAGELTDQGRITTLALGQRLRHLYIEQLRFLPSQMTSPDFLYLRTTQIERAKESLEQTFHGLYPPSERAPGCPPPTIYMRDGHEETLFPNSSACRRFGELTRAFADRCATRWNGSKEMDYLNQKIGKWMPESSPRVKVDSHPRLSGIMDTINATRAHGPDTRLRKEFYDDGVDRIIDKIAVEEWFAGYKESNEYRTLGIGSLLGDITERMVSHIESRSMAENGSDHEDYQVQRPKFALSGCHDTTLAAILTTLGAFEGERWPPFTSSIAIELFSKDVNKFPIRLPGHAANQELKTGWWAVIFGGVSKRSTTPTTRAPSSNQSQSQKDRMQNYYVRLRYNDRVMNVPACRPEGKHLDGDESFCTLETFKKVVDAFTPRNWREACMSNLRKGVLDADMRT